MDATDLEAKEEKEEKEEKPVPLLLEHRPSVAPEEEEGVAVAVPADVSRRAVWKKRARACGRWLVWFLSVLVANWSGCVTRE